MKKNVRRVLSVFLVLALCLGIGPVFKLDLHAKAGQKIRGTFGNYEYTAWIGYSDSEDACMIDKYNDDGSEVVNIPSHIDGIPVKYIDGFENATMKKVVIPNTVEIIASSTFSNCKSLTSVNIPSSIKEIEPYAFAYSGITTIVIPKSISINNNQSTERVFEKCDKLSSVSFEKGITSIPYELFMNCTGLKSITIPNTVKVIGTEAFKNCENLESVTFESGSSLNLIKDNAFTSCKKLNNITLPDSLTEIEPYAFYGCYSLEKLVLPNQLNTIGRYFVGATKVTSLTIPKSLENAEPYAFHKSGVVGYSDALDISFEEGVQDIPADFCKGGIINSVKLPESVTSIGARAFNINLDEIYIPPSVINIGDQAFGSYQQGGNASKIIGYSGTEAERYANEYGITFVSLGEAPQQQGDCIAVFSTNPTMTLIPKSKLTLGFHRVHDGKIDETWDQMAITVSDPSVLSISDYYSVSDGNYDEQGYAIDVTGLKPGLSHLVISDTKTGLSTTVTIKVENAADVRTFPIRKSFGVKVINGTVFDNYWFEYDETTKNYTIHLDAYNFNYYIGAVDIFDSEGKWVGSEIIDKFSNPHDIKSLGDKIGNFITDLGSGRPIIDFEGETLSNYKNKTMSQHTQLEFNVPEGGCFKISNSLTSSPGTYIWGSFDAYFAALSTFIDLAYGSLMDQTDVAFEKAKKSLNEKLQNTLVRQQICNFITVSANDRLLDLSQRFINAGTSWKAKLLIISNLTDVLMEMFKIIDFDIAQELKSFGITGLEEAAYLNPYWKYVEVVFMAAQAMDMIIEGADLYESTINPVYTFYTDRYGSNTTGLNSLFKDSGIIIEQNNAPIPEVVVQAFRVSNDTSLAPVLSNDELINNLETYNISLIKNDKTVQPSGKVTVHIPVPTGLNQDTCSVYRKESDGSWTKLDAKVKGNYLVFETDHFSLYAITGTLDKLSVKTLPSKLNYFINESLDSDGLTLQLGNQVITENYLCSPQVLVNEGVCEITVNYGHAETVFTVNVKENEVVEPEDPDESANDLDPSVNGIVQCPDGRWAMYKNGKVDTTCTTIAQNKYGWWRVENGYVNFEAQGIYQNKNGWWKTTNGKVTFLEFGLFENENGTWRVENSKVNFKANSIYKGKDGWYKTTNGKVTFDETGVFQNQFGWWYVKNSKVDFDYTGIASNNYGKWYINKGRVDFTKVGFVKVDGKTYTVLFGKVIFG